MSNDNFFSSKGIVFDDSLQGLTKEDINNLISSEFNGKDFLVNFYLSNNGGYFSNGAFFYRDKILNITPDDYSLLEIEGFYFIEGESCFESEYLLSINEVLSRRVRYSQFIKDFAKEHILFAVDAGDNDYWINTNTGEIKYIRRDLEDQVIEVAPTFYDFCINIEPSRRV